MKDMRPPDWRSQAIYAEGLAIGCYDICACTQTWKYRDEVLTIPHMAVPQQDHELLPYGPVAKWEHVKEVHARLRQ